MKHSSILKLRFFMVLFWSMACLNFGSTAWAGNSEVSSRSVGFEASDLATALPEDRLPFKLRQRADGQKFNGPKDFVNRCPLGTHLSPFDMPIYDQEGLFVVGYKTIWFCLPDDLEPEG